MNSNHIQQIESLDPRSFILPQTSMDSQQNISQQSMIPEITSLNQIDQVPLFYRNSSFGLKDRHFQDSILQKRQNSLELEDAVEKKIKGEREKPLMTNNSMIEEEIEGDS